MLLRQSPQTLVHSDQRNTCDGAQQRYVAKEYFLDATQGTDVNSIYILSKYAQTHTFGLYPR